MAFRLQVSREHITDDGITIEIDDLTGLYADNSSGYGAPNPDRNTLGLKLFAIEKASGGDVIAPVSFQNPGGATPKTVTSWRFSNNIGGVWHYYLIAVLDYAGGTTYNLGELVWYDTTGEFHEYVNATPAAGNTPTGTEDAYWKPISDYTDQEAYAVFQNAETLADANSLMDFISNTDGMDLITHNIDVPINRGIVADDCVCDVLSSLNTYEAARVDGEATIIMFQTGAYTQSQAMYEKLYNRIA